MGKKVEEKMNWVPPETDVTPEIVCKTVDQIKELFPEYVVKAQEHAKTADVENAALAEVTQKAKALRSKLADEMKLELRKWSTELLTNIGHKMKDVSEGVLGP